MNNSILCVGEVLWDSMPAGLFLGGAPHNVACHLHRLGQEVSLVSRVGDDVLGREALRRLAIAGLDAETIQVDAMLPTGFVKVDVDADGMPEYEIVQPVAWDAITLDERLQAEASRAQAVVFGSLAQREEISRRTVQTLSSANSYAVFDVNLRPPFVRRSIVERSLEVAAAVKLNDDELATMRAWFGLPSAQNDAIQSLAERFDCRLVCVTRGERGAALWHEGRWTEHPGHPADVFDTVGAGDAFLAALLASVLDGSSDEEALDRACRMGAFVASRSGAVPDYRVKSLADVATLEAQA